MLRPFLGADGIKQHRGGRSRLASLLLRLALVLRLALAFEQIEDRPPWLLFHGPGRCISGCKPCALPVLGVRPVAGPCSAGLACPDADALVEGGWRLGLFAALADSRGRRGGGFGRVRDFTAIIRAAPRWHRPFAWPYPARGQPNKRHREPMSTPIEPRATARQPLRSQ